MPVRIKGNDSIWKAIAACGAHSMGIAADGRLWVWGYGTAYDVAGNISYRPEQVGTDSDWAVITTGSLHFVAIKKDSTLWAWGRNVEGEAGDSTTNGNNHTPPKNIDSNHVWVYISAGYDHTLALKKMALYGVGQECVWRIRRWHYNKRHSWAKTNKYSKMDCYRCRV